MLKCSDYKAYWACCLSCDIKNNIKCDKKIRF